MENATLRAVARAESLAAEARAVMLTIERAPSLPYPVPVKLSTRNLMGWLKLRGEEAPPAPVRGALWALLVRRAGRPLMFASDITRPAARALVQGWLGEVGRDVEYRPGVKVWQKMRARRNRAAAEARTLTRQYWAESEA